MPIIVWIVLVILAIDAILGIILKLSPGSPDRNTIGWALRDRSKGFGALDEPILSWPADDDRGPGR